MAYTLQLNKKTTITAGIDTDDTSITLQSAVFSNFTADFLAIDYDNPTKLEIVKGDVTGTAVTITDRGQEGTSAVSHDAGAKIAYVFVPSHYSDLISIVQTSNTDGWIDPLETWTYASDTTITVPAGNLLKRSVGDKVKLNQSIPLTAYFPLEDKDSDVGSFTVANVGTPTYTAGKFSNALTLNGTDQALSITDAALLKPTGAFTIGGWIKKGTNGTQMNIFQSWSVNPTNQAGFRLLLTSGNVLQCYSAPNTGASTNSTITGGTAITDTNWHYVVLSYQSNHVKLFLDGNLEASGYWYAPAYHATNNLIRIGVCSDSGASLAGTWFNGQIDDLFFINGHAVDQYWVAAKYAAATAQTTANITATYQGYVTAVTDTLLTVTGGADYALYNGTITSPYYSKSSSPVGFPQWFNTTTTFFKNDGTTACAGTLGSYNFTINGRTVNAKITAGTIADPSGAGLSFLLPVTAVSAPAYVVVGHCEANARGGGMILIYSARPTKATVIQQSEAAWAASDNSFFGSFSYEI